MDGAQQMRNLAREQGIAEPPAPLAEELPVNSVASAVAWLQGRAAALRDRADATEDSGESDRLEADAVTLSEAAEALAATPINQSPPSVRVMGGTDGTVALVYSKPVNLFTLSGSNARAFAEEIRQRSHPAKERTKKKKKGR